MPPGAIYLVVGLLAAIENVFPPVPADTAVAIGAFISGTGLVSAPGIFLLTWAANVGGAAGMYLFARRAGPGFLASRVGKRIIPAKRLAWMKRQYAAHGTLGIFISRFIPGVRAVVSPFAGIARVPAWRVLVPVAVASGIWYGALTFLVSRYADGIHEVVRLVDRLSAVTVGLAVLVVVIVIVTIRLRRK